MPFILSDGTNISGPKYDRNPYGYICRSDVDNPYPTHRDSCLKFSTRIRFFCGCDAITNFTSRVSVWSKKSYKVIRIL